MSGILTGILSAVYVVGLLACLVLGAVRGPNVFERSPPDAVETSSLNVTWYGKIDGMERWHQVSVVESTRVLVRFNLQKKQNSVMKVINPSRHTCLFMPVCLCPSWGPDLFHETTCAAVTPVLVPRITRTRKLGKQKCSHPKLRCRTDRIDAVFASIDRQRTESETM